MDILRWKSLGTFFQYKNHQIFTIDEGAKDQEILLLIHGFPTASWDWWKMWRGLSKRFRLLTLDMLGFGFSDKPKKHPYHIKDQADIVEELLNSKRISRCNILSHDYGDTVVQELLARYNERIENSTVGLVIESVCLLNGGIFPERIQALPIQKILQTPIGPLISRLYSRNKLAKTFKKIFGPNTQPSSEELDNFWELMSNNGGKLVFPLLIKYLKQRKDNRDRWVGALQKSQAPLRFINGVLDPISGQNMVDRYKEIIPTPDVVELENIGHFPLFEAPELVLKHYFEFVDELKN